MPRMHYNARTMLQTMTFGQALRSAREAKGLSRREVEDATGISVRHLTYLENDEKEPGRRFIALLAKEFGPSILVAAFPEHVTLARSKNRATARKLGLPDWGIGSPPPELASLSG